MLKPILALGVAAVAVTAAPTDAQHYSNKVICTKWRHGHCVASQRLTRREARRAAQYRVGYRFGPSYSYTEIGALPQPFVTRYHLRDNFRYVNRDGYIYVVNPNTYRVVRIIPSL